VNHFQWQWQWKKEAAAATRAAQINKINKCQTRFLFICGIYFWPRWQK